MDSGIDSIPAQLFKHSGREVIKFLKELFMDIWREEKLPAAWRRTVIRTIHKKGDIFLCDNYRGVSLLPSSYKISTIILFK